MVANIPEDNEIPVLQLERKILKINSLVASKIGPRLKVDFGVNVVIKSVDKDKLSKSVNKFKEFLNKNSLNFD